MKGPYSRKEVIVGFTLVLLAFLFVNKVTGSYGKDYSLTRAPQLAMKETVKEKPKYYYY